MTHFFVGFIILGVVIVIFFAARVTSPYSTTRCGGCYPAEPFTGKARKHRFSENKRLLHVQHGVMYGEAMRITNSIYRSGAIRAMQNGDTWLKDYYMAMGLKGRYEDGNLIHIAP